MEFPSLEGRDAGAGVLELGNGRFRAGIRKSRMSAIGREQPLADGPPAVYEQERYRRISAVMAS